MKAVIPSRASAQRLMIMLVAEPPPRASQRPSNHSSSHGANSNIRAARAGPPVSYRVTDPFHRAGHRDKTVLLRTIEKGLYWGVIKNIITRF